MFRSFVSIALLATASLGLAAPTVASEEAAPPPSYSTSWQTDYATLRSIMFPHEAEGCKIMIQSRRGDDGSFIEKEGLDCNCDLVIDGEKDTFTHRLSLIQPTNNARSAKHPALMAIPAAWKSCGKA